MLSYVTRSVSNKRKIDNLEFIKIKNFCALKDIIKKVKKQPPDGRKYLVTITQIRF